MVQSVIRCDFPPPHLPQTTESPSECSHSQAFPDSGGPLQHMNEAQAELQRLLGMGLTPEIATILATKVAIINAEQRKRMWGEMQVLGQVIRMGAIARVPEGRGVRRRFPDKKLIVFDLDETLIYSSVTHPNPDHIIRVPIAEGEIQEIGVKFRPHVHSCLLALSRNFELAVFTASTPIYAHQIVDLLDPTASLISHRLYRDSCIEVGPLLLKDARVFQDLAVRDVLIVDNSALGFAFQRGNGVPVNSWTGQEDDEELLALTRYLTVFERLADVRTLNWAVFSSIFAY